MVEGASGFVYAISRQRELQVSESSSRGELESFIGQIRSATELPVALGFGIGDVETVEKVKEFVDGVILGSVLVQMIEEAAAKEEAIAKVSGFIAELRKVLG